MRVKRITTALVVVAVSATASLTAVASGKPSASRARMHAAHTQSTLMSDIAAARLATAKYATNLPRAKTAGYQIITKMIPDMGYHFLNPHVQGFDVRTPRSWSTNDAAARGSWAHWSGCSPPSPQPHRYPGHGTAPSPPPATTSTARSWPRARSRCAPRRAPKRVQRSTSGTRT